MSPILFRGALVKYAVAASTHGLVDLCEPQRLLPYSILLLPLPGMLTSCIFGVASVQHFAADLGLVPSIMSHIALVLCARINQPLTTNAFCLYYLGAHVPLTLHRFRKQRRVCGDALIVATCAAICFATQVSHNSVRIDHAAQRLVIAHVLASHVS
jgi:hypothetical protein